ncbi:hypothetical protein KEJ15_07985 [Candidatus Bathyarchaeota archaeon]|nr:hypothetical protein [Candidatus Bathyarchaeota archaeon]
MDKRIIYAIVAGIVMYSLLVYLAYVQRELTGPQLLLMLVAPCVVGVLSGGIKRGAAFGFVFSFAAVLIEVAILQSGALGDVNLVMAVIIMIALPWALISAGLGALGGLLGRHIFKKKVA